MLLTPRANCARHVDGEAGYLILMEVLSRKVTKEDWLLKMKQDAVGSRTQQKGMVLDDADVGNEDRKKPRHKPRRGERDSSTVLFPLHILSNVMFAPTLMTSRMRCAVSSLNHTK